VDLERGVLRSTNQVQEIEASAVDPTATALRRYFKRDMKAKSFMTAALSSSMAMELV